MINAQFSLMFDGTVAPGERRRDRGMKQAISTFAREQLRAVIVLVACKKREFTSEDVLPELPPGVRAQLQLHPNALGAAVHAAAKAGVIEATGAMAKAKRAEAHARKITVWRLKTAGA